MYNPFAGWSISGTWAEHLSYSLGGIDQPLNYGTPILAPASGTLRTSGGVGEYAAGQVGSAGRRSILVLDSPVLALSAIVFQHQSKFGTAGHYQQGEVIGWTGASANGNDWGGTVHLHHHGLTKTGSRIDWRGFIPLATAPAPASTSPLTPITGDDVSFAELIQTVDGSAQPASLVMLELQAQSRRTVTAAEGIAHITHRTIDAPIDVVLGDTLILVQALTNSVAALATKATDPAAQAAALAPILAPLLTSHAVGLTDADLARISAAVADEQAKRLAK